MEPRRILSLWYCLGLVFSVIDPSECRDSRVCLWPEPMNTACHKHILNCEDDYRIRIISARYMFIKRTSDAKCSCGSRNCDVCPELYQETYAKKLSKKCGNMNYRDLLSKCSYQEECFVPMLSQQNHTCRNSTSVLRASYSHIKYSCLEVNNVVDFCNGDKSGKLLSILYTSSSHAYNCSCRIKSSDTSGSNRTYFMRSMDIRNLTSEGVDSFNLSFTSGNKSRNVVNGKVKHNSKLFEAPINQESVITLSISRTIKSPDRLWILINGLTEQLQVTCQSEVETTTSDPRSRSPKATAFKVLQSTEQTTSTPSTQDPRSPKATTFKVLQSTEQTTSTPSTQVGVIVASVAGSVVVIAAIIVALIIYQRKRNPFEKRQERKIKPARSLVEDETVYFAIEETPKVANVQEDKTRVTEQPAYVQIELKEINPTNMAVHASNKHGYDHVTLAANPEESQSSRDIYDHVTGNAEEDCYNRLGPGLDQRTIINGEYDTAASASKAVKDLKNQGDYYSYDHLGASTGTSVSDYDTTQQRVQDTK